MFIRLAVVAYSERHVGGSEDYALLTAETELGSVGVARLAIRARITQQRAPFPLCERWHARSTSVARDARHASTLLADVLIWQESTACARGPRENSHRLRISAAALRRMPD